jgi:hydantoinase/carbamoylase family amidase
MPCIGSRVATGVRDAGGLHEIKDRDGVSVAASASAVGLDPARVSDGHLGRADLRGFIELHIEQGIVLETRGRSVGLVDAIAGSTRLLLRFTGRADHSGATPMALRRDALTAASELVVDIEAAARRHPTSVATVGRLEVSPGSITTVPGEVMLTIDFRDVDSERQRELADSVLDEAIRISRRRALDVSASLLSDQSPVLLHKPLRELLAGALGTLGVPFSVLPSGAMHDAAYMARRTPSALLFVPSRDGVSHSRDEHSELAHIARGCEAIATAIVDDELRQQPAFPHAEEGERA